MSEQLKQPRAAAVLAVQDGAVLVVVSPSRPGHCGLPCGKIEAGETPAQAAARELLEETGLAPVQGLTPLLTAVEEAHGGVVQTFYAPVVAGVLTKGHGAMWSSWWALCSGPFGAYNARVRAAYENLPEPWSHKHGSGSLRRAIEEGMAWREMYLAERTAMEFGWGFRPYQASRVTFGTALASEDDPATTEACWFARTLRYRAATCGRSLSVRVVHATVAEDENSREGLALEITPPTSDWLPADRRLVAFVTDGLTGRVVNPC